MNDTVNQINKGKPSQNPSGARGSSPSKVQDLRQPTGWRSAQFDFLLEEAAQNQVKPTRENSPYLRKQREAAKNQGW